MTDPIYSMKLHEQLTFQLPNHAGIQVVRVPGGWLYTQFFHYMLPNSEHHNHPYTENYAPTTVFVPFDNQFQIDLTALIPKQDEQ